MEIIDCAEVLTKKGAETHHGQLRMARPERLRTPDYGEIVVG